MHAKQNNNFKNDINKLRVREQWLFVCPDTSMQYSTFQASDAASLGSGYRFLFLPAAVVPDEEEALLLHGCSDIDFTCELLLRSLI
jgi:hypothetical protein